MPLGIETYSEGLAAGARAPFLRRLVRNGLIRVLSSYHIYHVCLSLRPFTRNAFEALPSHRELGDAAIAWLNELRESGVAM